MGTRNLSLVDLPVGVSDAVLATGLKVAFTNSLYMDYRLRNQLLSDIYLGLRTTLPGGRLNSLVEPLYFEIAFHNTQPLDELF